MSLLSPTLLKGFCQVRNGPNIETHNVYEKWVVFFPKKIKPNNKKLVWINLSLLKLSVSLTTQIQMPISNVCLVFCKVYFFFALRSLLHLILTIALWSIYIAINKRGNWGSRVKLPNQGHKTSVWQAWDSTRFLVPHLTPHSTAPFQDFVNPREVAINFTICLINIYAVVIQGYQYFEDGMDLKSGTLCGLTDEVAPRLGFKSRTDSCLVTKARNQGPSMPSSTTLK